tara:strand:+ start:118 stop:285 length:168 start_codon:yes stop_codon:yes gene_type:complete
MAIQQYVNQATSPILGKTLSGQDTIEGSPKVGLDSSNIKIINNQDLNHLELGHQN